MNKYLNQNEFIRNFNDEHREEFNPAFFYRSDDDIIQELQKVHNCFLKGLNHLIKGNKGKIMMIQVFSFNVLFVVLMWVINDDYYE